MFGSTLFRCCVNSSASLDVILQLVSSTYLSHHPGGMGAVEIANSSKASMYKLQTSGETGDPIGAP